MRHCCSTSDGGTSQRVLLVELLDDLLGERRSRRGPSAIFSSLRVHVGAELDERLEVADVLRELVVERRAGRAPSGP